MTTATRSRAATLDTSFSFYVPTTKLPLLRPAALLSDGLTIRGPNGPAEARATLGPDWEGPLLFDRAGYEPRVPDVDPDKWFEMQAVAGADRLLTPGTWIPWDGGGDALQRSLERETTRASRSAGSTLLVALDSRWLGKAAPAVIDALQEVPGPIALVLAHRGDPLSDHGALDGLLALLRSVSDITLLRSDHGAIGAVAFGACHGSIGLQPTYRHFVPQGSRARYNPTERTARVFVRDLLDWFTVGKIMGWGASSIRFECHLECRDGARIDRFFDPQFEHQANVHNWTTLSRLARYIFEDEPESRRRSFATLCAEAVDNYGRVGKMSDLIEPKPQLVQWALWA